MGPKQVHQGINMDNYGSWLYFNMPHFINLTNMLFEMAPFSDIYVCKSMLIAEQNKVNRTEKRYICIIGPRRFGQSVRTNILSTYYTGMWFCGTLFHLEIEEHVSYKNI